MGGDVRHADAVARALPDERERALDEQARGGGPTAGGGAADDPADADRGGRRRLSALGHRLDGARREPALALEVGDDARERRVRVLAEEGLVVHAEHGNAPGHGYPRRAADGEDARARFVVGREHAGRRGQRSKPCGETRGADAARAFAAVRARVRERRAEGRAAFGGPRLALDGADEPERPVDAVPQQLARGEPPDGGVVAVDDGDARPFRGEGGGPRHVEQDDRDPDGLQDVLELRPPVVEDEAVEPAVEPGPLDFPRQAFPEADDAHVPSAALGGAAEEAREHVGPEPAAHPEGGQHAADRSVAVAFHGAEF